MQFKTLHSRNTEQVNMQYSKAPVLQMQLTNEYYLDSHDWVFRRSSPQCQHFLCLLDHENHSLQLFQISRFGKFVHNAHRRAGHTATTAETNICLLRFLTSFLQIRAGIFCFFRRVSIGDANLETRQMAEPPVCMIDLGVGGGFHMYVYVHEHGHAIPCICVWYYDLPGLPRQTTNHRLEKSTRKLYVPAQTKRHEHEKS